MSSQLRPPRSVLSFALSPPPPPPPPLPSFFLLLSLSSYVIDSSVGQSLRAARRAWAPSSPILFVRSLSAGGGERPHKGTREPATPVALLS